MSKPKDRKVTISQDQVLDGVFELIETHGWAHLTFHDITDHIGITLSELHQFFPSKHSILQAMIARIDQETLMRVSPDIHTLSPSDRLFDVLMARFDASKPYKEAIQRVWQESYKHPLLIASNFTLGYNSMVWILEAAGLHHPGILGVLQVNGFGLLFLKLVHTWLEDKSDDMSKTMSAVDHNVKKFSEFLVKKF